MKNKILICEDFDNDIRWQPGERLHHLFEHRCDELSENGNAQHLAVDGTKGAWSYKELDQGANQLARYLKIKGLGAGDVIGLLFDKDVHSYVSMLAVLKIHAAYVPLDPAFPEDRIAFIAEDAGLKSILTMSPYLQLTESSDLPIISLDTVSAQIESQENTRLHEEETGQPVSELCYVIYTSGSTGRPKGVPIEHASICNFVRVAAEVYDYRSTDRVYQGLTLAFDFSVEEIWIPLAVGATLLPNQTGSSLLGADLSEFLRKHRATAMCCVPTLLATIEEDLPELRFLIVSGEACPGDLIRRWYSPKRTILNAYGPTEATVTATLSWPKPNEPVTIGKPLPTYSIVILEPGTQQVLPFGELGEIAVAGIGVARGYLNREDQTQKAFIDDFLNIPNNPAGLIYRTGDLGRINENGDIEYRGRIDTQVKIRGYRIELSEIESVIMQIPQVGQAVVDTFEPVPGVQELVAYYTLKDGAEQLSLEELVDLLRSLLPNYMVPAFYEHLQIIPMMTSDKVDRKALPAPSGLRMCADENRIFVEPQNPLERDIARVLAGLLKLDAVSVEDDFFDDLGANSLLMAQFSSRLRSELGIADFSMREIYTSPSVRKLSEFLGSTGQKQMPLIRNNPSHRATNWQYIFSGFAQLVPIFAGILLSAFILWKGYSWIIEAPSSLNAYGRTILFSTAAFVLSVLIPVGLKWLLIGKWQPEEFPVWSLRYLRFWFVRKITQFNPMAVFAGSPLYIGYLKLLGARVSWKCFIRSGVPVCTDLFSIGEGAVVSKRAILSGYRAESGRITTGGITLERDTFVGEAAVLDIDTVMEAGSELAHASSLQKGQRLEAGKSYHGSPAQQTENRYRQLENGTASVTRMVLYSLVQLVLAFFVFGPLPILIIHHFLGADHNSSSTRIGELLPETKTLAHLQYTVTWPSLIYAALIVVGLISIVLMPRFLNLFLKEGRDYPLYGVHYFIHQMLEAISNSAFYNILFGDSSYIVYFLGAIGYKFRGLVQTGSNFGLSQHHDNPFLSEFGKGSMISDGFALVNADYSAKSLRLSRANIGAHNFVGNNIIYPAQGRTGDNCLLGTKVMVPIHGPLRENVGLLGSPSFEIPRSVRHEHRFEKYKQPDVLRKRLRKKNASNLITMFFLLLSNIIAMVVLISGWFYTHTRFVEHEALYLAGLFIAASVFLIPYYVFVDRASLGFRRLKPEYCSIYEEYYWKHERYWKLGISNRGFLKGIWSMFNGTPFMGALWRLLGVKVGKKLFDDGTYIAERSLVSIGDYCTLNRFSVLQCHSLEESIFKSDYSFIGDECTIGVNGFVHYGVDMQNDVALEPDSFLMKGERPDAHSIWQGNPAKAVLEEKNTLAPDIVLPVSRTPLQTKQIIPEVPLMMFHFCELKRDS